MPDASVQDVGPFAGHSPDQERPLGGYAALIGTFFAGAAGFGVWLRSSGRSLPDTVGIGDLLLITAATHKATRLLGRDRVTSAIRAPFTRFQDDAGADVMQIATPKPRAPCDDPRRWRAAAFSHSKETHMTLRDRIRREPKRSDPADSDSGESQPPESGDQASNPPGTVSNQNGEEAESGLGDGQRDPKPSSSDEADS